MSSVCRSYSIRRAVSPRSGAFLSFFFFFFFFSKAALVGSSRTGAHGCAPRAMRMAPLLATAAAFTPVKLIFSTRETIGSRGGTCSAQCRASRCLSPYRPKTHCASGWGARGGGHFRVRMQAFDCRRASWLGGLLATSPR
ncbi:hypothetical protein LX32DRAFT_331491 [Colletotrichum zoysiae]|uniref:Uncharacterized protein n=1 Tax=Colletotrichum zoysiae TaxID=1216348 RepID=A0AAD9HL36_9PEZI|nr:hypothetical protein LX32DRAFT_331491 [Colletotrichum zoysiae]